IEARMARLVPSHYFHVVFTLPATLRPLVLRNRRRLFTLLFRAATQTLLPVGRDPARLGARLGVPPVLPPWPPAPRFHPPLHAFARFKDQLYRQDWIVYAKRPFAGPRQLFRYLGRYTHRVGLSNHRLRAVTATSVRFATKHGHDVTLAPEEFIRRFLLHVLPRGFVKIRHCGLFAPGPAASRAREHARRLLGATPAEPLTPGPREDWRTLLRRLTGLDLAHCPRCSRGTMVAV